jgi:ribonuclease BN (tRNA processing enzyme)
MDINVNFTYRNVGQGLFYTGRIGSFNFVYDCGSENRTRLKESILSYKERELRRNLLDVLIISHFHDDHIIGLEELLNNLHIDTVILPYLTPIERLIISLQKPYLPAWYYEFLSDPVRFLLIGKKNVGKIIIVGGKEGGKGSAPPEELPPNKPENVKIKWEDEMRDDTKLRIQIKKYEDPEWDKFIDERKLLFVKSHYNYATALNGFWVFKFFNYKLEDQKISAFENCLRQNKLSPGNSESLRKIIKDKK